MVTDDTALEAITAGPDGIFAGLERCKADVDMSTVSPRISRKLAAEVDSVAQMLDARCLSWRSSSIVATSASQPENGRRCSSRLPPACERRACST
jgi:hypothetical protein